MGKVRLADKQTWIMAGLAALFFLPFLGGVHLFDWDEINFAEIAREMILRNDYLKPHIDFKPFYEKPPLFIWFQVIAMQLVGVGEAAARLPNAVCGIVTIVWLYNRGKKFYNPRFGLLWAGTYLGSVLPFLYFKSGIIDPWFNLFIFLGLSNLIFAYWKRAGFQLALPRSYSYYLLSGGFFTGLAILTKGPVAFLLVALPAGVYWLYANLRFYIPLKGFMVFIAVAVATTGLWFGTEWIRNGSDFIREFTVYQIRLFSTADAGHKGFIGYHFVVLLLGCFPASVFALRALFRIPKPVLLGEVDFQEDFRRWMRILLWTVLVLFSLVGTKIVHYSSLAYFPLTFLSAWVLYMMLEKKLVFTPWMRWFLWGIGSLYAVLVFVFPWIGKNAQALKPLFRDPFAQGNLDAQIHWSGAEVLPGVLLLLVLGVGIRAFRNNHTWKGFRVLFGGTALFVFLTLVFFIKRIEGYSQRAAIEFFQEKSTEDCYIITHGYKSYAHLFYAKKQAPTRPEALDSQTVQYGNPDKPVYLVTKIHRKHEVEDMGTFDELYQKNGFVFYVRK